MTKDRACRRLSRLSSSRRAKHVADSTAAHPPSAETTASGNFGPTASTFFTKSRDPRGLAQDGLRVVVVMQDIDQGHGVEGIVGDSGW